MSAADRRDALKGRVTEAAGSRRWTVRRWTAVLFSFPALFLCAAWAGLSASAGTWLTPQPVIAVIVFLIAAAFSCLVFVAARSLMYGFSREFLSRLAAEGRPADAYEMPPFRVHPPDAEAAVFEQANRINRKRLDKAGRRFSGKRALWTIDTAGQLPWMLDAERAAASRAAFARMKVPVRSFQGGLVVVAGPLAVEEHEKPKQYFDSCGVLLEAVSGAVVPQGGEVVYCAGATVAAVIPTVSQGRLGDAAVRTVRVARDLQALLAALYPGRDALVLADLSAGHEAIWFGDANLRYQCETPELWALRLGGAGLAGGGLRLSRRLVEFVRGARPATEAAGAE